MPLGPIHLIAEETETGAGAVYFCGVEDAIAAINPARKKGFPRDTLCSECLRVFEARAHGQIAPP